MASKSTGYQGFRGFAVQECPTLKPGETYAARATKFSQMGSTIITPVASNRLGHYAHESMLMQTGKLVQPSDYHVPDKRGVSAQDKLPQSKTFVANSTYLQDFPVFESELQRVLAVPVDIYQQAFNALAEDQREQWILLTQMPALLRRALGEAAVPRVLELFVSYLDRYCDRDHITWDALQRSIDHVNGLVLLELQTILARKPARGPPSALDKTELRVIPATTPSSGYRVDFGAYGENPLDRPYMRKRGMATTTGDLQNGTTQDTYQIPGYAGFLPRTTHNPHACDQANGEVPRSINGDLRLYHSDNLPGYTGHKPVDCKNYHGECQAGSNPRTTTGTDYRPHGPAK